MINKYMRKHIGKVRQMRDGGIVEIIDGGSKKDYCTVRLLGGINEYIMEVRYSQIKEKRVKNAYIASVYGKGYIGIGEYKSYVNEEQTISYCNWVGMLKRCYSEKYHGADSYKDVYVCDEWLNYQNFAEWHYKNYSEFKNEKTNLDKDLLSGVDKFYSPENCIYIPQSLNKFITNNKAKNTSGFIGIGQSSSGKWYAQISDFKTDGTNHLGTFDLPEEASEAYNLARDKNVKLIKGVCVGEWGITNKNVLNKIK